jgi:hypothetical protein
MGPSLVEDFSISVLSPLVSAGLSLDARRPAKVAAEKIEEGKKGKKGRMRPVPQLRADA